MTATQIVAWLTTNWQEICLVIAGIVSLIGTLENAFKAHPKIETALHDLTDAFSFIEHIQPGQLQTFGTFLNRLKIPLLQRSPKPGASPTSTTVPPAAMLVLIGILSLHLACATTPLGTALINCGEAALSTEATAVGPQVLSILTGGAVDWATQLSQLVVTLGTGVVCAVQAIVNSITNKATAGELAPSDQIALVRAQAWLNSYGVRTPATGMQIRVVKP